MINRRQKDPLGEIDLTYKIKERYPIFRPANISRSFVICFISGDIMLTILLSVFLKNALYVIILALIVTLFLKFKFHTDQHTWITLVRTTFRPTNIVSILYWHRVETGPSVHELKTCH